MSDERSDAVRARREQMLLRMLVRATQAMNSETFRRLAELGFAEAQSGYVRVLGNLDTEGTRIRALARRMGTTRQAASQLVQEIEGRGFVERTPDPDDKRGVIVRFTKRGRSMLDHALDVMTGLEQEYEAKLGARDYAKLKQVLQRLVESIDEGGGLGLD